MTRILTWLAATLAVLAAITYYQADHSGRAERSHGPASTACGSTRPQTGAGQVAETEPPTREAAAPDDDKADDPCASSDHSGRPGESK
jgi:hypothetical protein